MQLMGIGRTEGEFRVARKFALTSTGPYSGKTTLAAHLRDSYGFVHADHSLTLVRSFVEAWNTANDAPPITVEWVYKHKEVVRRQLQDHGYDIGFNDPDETEHWIKKTLSQSGCSTKQAKCWGSQPEICPNTDVVFDSIRGEIQAEMMHSLGFKVVQLEISDQTRCVRAGLLGKNCKDVMAAINKAPELERGVAHPDIRLNAELPVDQLGRILMHRPEDAHGYQVFGSQL